MLYAAMLRKHALEPNARLVVYADAKAPYGQVIRVIDAAKFANIADVSFVTE